MAYYAYDEFRPCETFQDILDKAKLVENDERIDTKDKLFDFEYASFEIHPLAECSYAFSFFVTMDLCYQMVTDNKYISLDEEGFNEYFQKPNTMYQNEQEYLRETIEAQEEQEEQWRQEVAQDQGYGSYEEY